MICCEARWFPTPLPGGRRPFWAGFRASQGRRHVLGRSGARSDPIRADSGRIWADLARTWADLGGVLAPQKNRKTQCFTTFSAFSAFSSSKASSKGFEGVLDPLQGLSRALLGPSWPPPGVVLGSLGASWGPLGGLGASPKKPLGPLSGHWGCRGPFGGPTWATLKPKLGRSGAHLGAISGPRLPHPCSSRRACCASARLLHGCPSACRTASQDKTCRPDPLR